MDHASVVERALPPRKFERDGGGDVEVDYLPWEGVYGEIDVAILRKVRRKMRLRYHLHAAIRPVDVVEGKPQCDNLVVPVCPA